MSSPSRSDSGAADRGARWVAAPLPSAGTECRGRSVVGGGGAGERAARDLSSRVGDVSTVAAVVIETDGTLSVIPKDAFGDWLALAGIS